MLLFVILALILAFLLIFMVFVASVAGTIGIIIFADVIVCIFIIAWLLKKFIL